MNFLNTRINRTTYWICLLCFFAFNILLTRITKRPFGASEVILIGLSIPRLHDAGKSTVWLGGAVLGEIGLAIFAFVTMPMKNAMAVLNVYGLIILVLLIWLGCIRGEPGANRFGEPPAPGFGFRPRSKPN
jgi:uncharacterized membrane protein YhaH (DUF805 family)